MRILLRALLLAAACLPALAQTNPAAGVFLGTLDVGGGHTLRLQVHLTPAATGGGYTCALDSLDQHASGIPCVATIDAGHIKFTIAAVGATFDGKLSADAKTITGTFTQGGDLPLTLTREDAPIAAAPPPPMDAAQPAATAANIQSILDKDLAAALANGDLAPAAHGGVTIGVLSHGVRKIFSYGAAKPDSVFEIGSITKTFTATILAQMVEQKTVRLDETVRELLPAGTVAKPATGAEITLLDLSDQHSGLPRMPTNFAPDDAANPYADYTPKLLYAFIAQHGVARDPAAPFGYSNVGVGLLGQALAVRAGMTYPQLLQAEVTGPLGMTDTATVLTPSMKARFIQGYADGPDHAPSHSWELDALNGAGGIRSTAADMLTYLQAQLRPNDIAQKNVAFPDAATLGAAIVDTHMLHADAGPGMHIALNWFHFDRGGFWHNGATGGYTAYARFSPEHDYAIVVLSNIGPGTEGSLADRLGAHIAQRMEGEPALSLTPKS